MSASDIHNSILDKLLRLKEENSNFTFWLRRKGEGLNKGYWFHGTESYISVGLVKEGSGNLATQSIALHFEDIQGKVKGSLILENRKNTNTKLSKFYSELANDLIPTEKNHTWYKSLDSRSGINSIISSFWEYYPKIIEIIRKHELDEQLLISESDFNKSLLKIKKFKKIIEAQSLNNSIMSIKNLPLNQILYGPPGTGKTYSTIDKVVEICDHDYQKGNHEHNKKIYDRLVSEGRVVFTTFHQSMAYEDFIEGIKPVVPKSKTDPIQYLVQNGVFKEICESCIEDILEVVAKRKTPKILADYSFPELYSRFIEAIQQNEITVVTKTGIKADITTVSSGGNMRLTTGQSNLGYIISQRRLEKLVNTFPNPEKIGNVNNEIRDVIGGSNTSLYYAALVAFNEFSNKFIKGEVDVPEPTEISGIELTDYEKKSLSPFVLIIDEINRGNVSAIFGELISLIEKDKRFGNSNALYCTLPYSKKQFIVPPNLYIIGTMNTADRSVEALDTALRRRFTFEEMLPRPELVSPSAMLSRLMWQYKDVPWEDKEYKTKETDLKELFQISDDNIWLKRKDTWKIDMMSKDQSVLTHLNYVDDASSFNLQTLLETINARIEVLIDRDHTIGHSYFMDIENIDDLKQAFKNKIIPLLQEYFYGDYKKMEMVIGPDFFDQTKKTQKVDFATNNSDFEIETGTYQLIDVKSKEFNIVSAIKRLLNKKEDNTVEA